MAVRAVIVDSGVVLTFLPGAEHFSAVPRVAVPYRPYFYAPLALLHALLLVRLAGDWMLAPE